VWKRDAACLDPLPATANGPFDWVFLDPPYGKELDIAALLGLKKGWLAPEATIMVERARNGEPLAVAGYEVLDARDYGAAQIVFLRASKPPSA
jgi:16S rRNA (guanine966-N2)-methyltransferase